MDIKIQTRRLQSIQRQRELFGVDQCGGTIGNLSMKEKGGHDIGQRIRLSLSSMECPDDFQT